MKRNLFLRLLLLLSAITAIIPLVLCGFASAHLDALDGPIVQDVRKALDTKDVSPILKWVKQEDETTVREAFVRALHARNKKNAEEAEKWFFANIIKIHLEGREVPFTGLKPAGKTDPAITAIDQVLISGSPDELLKQFSGDDAYGIRKRFEIAAEAYRHKDESVAQGRAFVEIYIDFIHYVTQMQRAAANDKGNDENSHGARNPDNKHPFPNVHKNEK